MTSTPCTPTSTFRRRSSRRPRRPASGAALLRVLLAVAVCGEEAARGEVEARVFVGTDLPGLLADGLHLVDPQGGSGVGDRGDLEPAPDGVLLAGAPRGGAGAPVVHDRGGERCLGDAHALRVPLAEDDGEDRGDAA